MIPEIIEVGFVRDGFHQSYRKGICGVVKIIKQGKNGQMALIPYYEILGEKGLLAEMHEVTYVRYD